MGPTATIDTMSMLERELETVKRSLDSTFGLTLGNVVNAAQLPAGLSLDQCLNIHYAYLTVVLSLHTVLAYPWVRALLGVSNARDDLQKAVDHSATIVMKVSRDAILMTEHISFKANTCLP